MDKPNVNERLWVELAGDLILARLRGEPSPEMLRECQQQVLLLASESGRFRVLYDTLEMTPPPVEVTFVQRQLDQEPGAAGLRRAIVVPNSRLAYLARLAFGEGDYRVFYGDMVGAIRWLSRD
jgi:hypothetical protein